MAIMSEVNLMSFRNIDDTDRGNHASISVLIAMLRFLFACVVIFQLRTPE